MDENLLQKTEEIRKRAQLAKEKQGERKFQRAQTKALMETLELMAEALLKSDAMTRGVEVVNPVKSVKTPDVAKVVDKLDKVLRAVEENKPDTNTKTEMLLEQLNESIQKLPKELPKMPKPQSEVSVKNQKDYSALLNTLIGKLDKMKPVFDPKIEVKPQVKNKVDLKSLEERLDALIDVQVAATKQEPPKMNLEPVIDRLWKIEQVLEKILTRPIPVGFGGGGTTTAAASDISGGLDNLLLADGTSHLTLQSDTTNDVLLLN